MIPKGWVSTTLGEVGKWCGGGTPSKANKKFWDNGTIPWVSPKDMKVPRITKTEDYITEVAIKNSSATLVRRGSILLVTRSSILQHSLPCAMADLDLSINQDIKAISIKDGIDNEFIFSLIRGNEKNLLEQCAKVGTTVESIDFEGLKNFKILLPPKNEQEKIAKILSTWDEAIEKIDRIINQTEKRFRGLGQKLLFNGTNKYRLYDLCTPKQWKTISSNDLLEEGIPVFGANSWIGFYSEANHQKDCIAVTCRGATCGTVNYVKGPSYITGNSMALDSLKSEIIDRNFLYFYLRTLELNSIISGSAQPQITGAAIGKIELTLPSLTDQIKVSSILMDATKELDCFKKMKDRILIQKQGLMQQLLTGKKRVKV